MLKSYNIEIPTEDETFVTGQMFTLSVPPWRLVWVGSTGPASLSILMHELLHLVSRICYDKGVPIVARLDHLSAHGDETACYLFEYFSKALFKRLL